jgi:hypothetical protein
MWWHGEVVPEGWEVHHRNGDKGDNSPWNLEGMSREAHQVLEAERAGRVVEEF